MSLLLALAVIGVRPATAGAASTPTQARAAVVAGATAPSAGLFVPAVTRVLDTRSGLGGYSTPMPVNAWRSFQVTGVGDIPASGVSAVQATVTVVSPASAGNLWVSPSSAPSTVAPAVIYGAGVTGSVSGATIVAVGTDGKLQVMTGSAVTVVIDVQGYYTAGDEVAAGGYVPLDPRRVADSRIGTGGLPDGKLLADTVYTVSTGSKVPAGASAVFVTFTTMSYSTAGGYLTPWATGDPATGVSLNFPGNVNTAISAAVPLSPEGTFDLRYRSTGDPIHLMVHVLGYYSAATGESGAFTPAVRRVLDTRVSPNVQIPGGAIVTVPLAGVKGVPAAGSGISAIAVNMSAIHLGSHAGNVQLWAADRPQPPSAVVEYPASTVTTIRTNLTVLATSPDGKVKLRNNGTDPINVVLDVFGWYSNVTPAIAGGQSVTGRFATLQAGKAGGPWVTYQYRVGTVGAFANVPLAHVTVPGTATHPAAWPVTRNSAGVFDAYRWDVPATVGLADQLVQVQACYRTTASDPDPVCAMPSTVQLGVSGFQNAYATTDVGPGSVAELTGDYQIGVGDVDEAAALSALSVSRTLTTLAPTAERSGAVGVFGPGWTADLADAGGVGAADLTVADHLVDGYLVLQGADGSASMYQARGCQLFCVSEGVSDLKEIDCEHDRAEEGWAGV
ncbi:hypothetical protein [Nakamurella lactea]|uniref:hypothetical protein n=1 Tax=Nakamurella lactea TaxID=459515 RepID=UPI0012B59F91|nr:hypothetical protein [Nakamurella lactea]